ncbi:MAG: hypothetical protein BGO93_01675 [Mesorhizobium sp. 65-26]|nr:MAG: hypothetical protein BGO93_01675 [Mesorhizobium sp. 65-26]
MQDNSDGYTIAGGSTEEKRVMVHRPLLMLAAFGMLVVPEARAATLRMVCENPRRDYVVTYEEGAKTMSANETAYRVLAVERTKRKLVVAGLTVDDGPTFRAHFRPEKKIEYFSNNALMQTDACR